MSNNNPYNQHLVRGRSKKRRDDGTDDGTPSRARICKQLYGLSQGDETGDWTDDGIGLLHVICYGYVTVYLVVDKPQL